jgi:glycosyltransferase involved in cell wall biosynthesis
MDCHNLMKPTVSVCVPTYNGSEFLAESLDSILAQTFTDFELLIVDDQSSDQTLAIVAEYAAQDSRIKVIQNPQNLGLVGNWNRCIELAQGEWIKFVFQDDLIAPTCLEKMLNASDGERDIVFCRRQFLFSENTSAAIRQDFARFLEFDRAFPDFVQITAQAYCKTIISQPAVNIIGEPTSVMVRKRAFEQLGRFNPNLIQICDLELWHRVASNSGITFVREILATFRVHGASATAKNHAGRTYRMHMDCLILDHELAVHSVYQNLRSLCPQRFSGQNLPDRSMQGAYMFWRRGNQIAKMQPEERPNIDQAWEELIQKYPRFAQVKTLNLFKQTQYRIAARLESYISRLNMLGHNY